MIALTLLIVMLGAMAQGAWWLAGICAIGALGCEFLRWVWS